MFFVVYFCFILSCFLFSLHPIYLMVSKNLSNIIFSRFQIPFIFLQSEFFLSLSEFFIFLLCYLCHLTIITKECHLYSYVLIIILNHLFLYFLNSYFMDVFFYFYDFLVLIKQRFCFIFLRCSYVICIIQL